MSRKEIGALLLLSALWGFAFLFMRIASPVLGPILLIELRVLLAGLALLGYGALMRRLPPLRGHWRQFLMVGVLNSAVPFSLAATATLRLPSSFAATLNATTPLFGALVAALWMRERLTLRKVLGLATGLAGVGALVGFGPVPVSTPVLWSIGASLAAAVSYGVAAVYTKVRLPGVRPEATALYSQLFAAAALAPLLPFAPARQPLTLAVAGSVLALAVACTAVAYRLYFYLIEQAGPTKATTVTFLSPAFGMLWGALLLREPLAPGSFAGFGLILVSAALVTLTPAPSRSSEPVRQQNQIGGGQLDPFPHR